MLFHLPADLAHFRRCTWGNVVVTGRRTLMTYPGGEPLEGRENIVLSRDTALQIPGATVCTLEQLPQRLAPFSNAGREIYIAGGGSIYEQLCPYCDGAVITHVQAQAEQADTFFPRLDQLPGWYLKQQSTPYRENGMQFTFAVYSNRFPTPFLTKL